ncbi:MAG: cupin domain-containing protein [Armatimonadota bacterium]|nr:cupin domain-containing protein [Armatimonadota bacterium]
MKTQVLRADHDFVALPLVEGRGEVRAIIWPGMAARHRSLHYLSLAAGARTVPHRHPNSEAVYYVISGTGAVHDLDAEAAYAVRAGSVVLMTAGTRYRIAAAPDAALVCIGGPCPPDPALYASAGDRRRAAHPEGLA